MLILSDNLIKKYKQTNVVVYSKEKLHNGCECFSTNEGFVDNNYYTTNVKLGNIKHKDGKFYYTNEDLPAVCDFYPPDLLPVIGAFVKGKKHKLSKSFIVDPSGLPAFSSLANEDIKINEYRLYITLFNDYSVKECQFDRKNLYDAKYRSSKFDLEAKIQNSDFLHSKDFTAINVKRKDEENVLIGLIVKEPENGEFNSDYGKVYIDMDNIINVKWH